MEIRVTILIALVLATAGCVEKRKPASAQDASLPANQPSAQEAAPPQAPAEATAKDYAKYLSTAPTRAATIIDIASIQRAVAQFQTMEGRLPASIEELVAKRYLPQNPPVPPGKRLKYDPATGKVEMVSL